MIQELTTRLAELCDNMTDREYELFLKGSLRVASELNADDVMINYLSELDKLATKTTQSALSICRDIIQDKNDEEEVFLVFEKEFGGNRVVVVKDSYDKEDEEREILLTARDVLITLIKDSFDTFLRSDEEVSTKTRCCDCERY